MIGGLRNSLPRWKPLRLFPPSSFDMCFFLYHRCSKTNITSTAICLDLIGEDEQIRELQCGHVYHSACLNLWVERGHHDCPLCKFDILGLQQNLPPSPQVETANHDPAPMPMPTAPGPRLHHPGHPHHHGPHVVVISNPQPPSDFGDAHLNSRFERG